MREILISKGYQTKDFGNNLRCRPLYRDSGNDTSLSVDKKTGKWYDFSIGIGGEFSDLLRLIGADSSEIESYKQLHSNYSEEELDFDKHFDPQILAQLSKDYSYWVNRNISTATLKEFGGGVDLHWKLKNRYVFPVYNGHNKIIGLFGRDITNNPKIPKYKILGKKKNFRWPLFLNNSIIQQDRTAILPESPACIFRLWDNGIKNAICLFGTDISPNLINLLVRYNLKSIVIATNNEPDNDNIGNNAAEKIKRKLLEFFDPAAVTIKLPTKKDFAEMTCEEIYTWKNLNPK